MKFLFPTLNQLTTVRESIKSNKLPPGGSSITTSLPLKIFSVSDTIVTASKISGADISSFYKNYYIFNKTPHYIKYWKKHN